MGIIFDIFQFILHETVESTHFLEITMRPDNSQSGGIFFCVRFTGSGASWLIEKLLPQVLRSSNAMWFMDSGNDSSLFSDRLKCLSKKLVTTNLGYKKYNLIVSSKCTPFIWNENYLLLKRWKWICLFTLMFAVFVSQTEFVLLHFYPSSESSIYIISLICTGKRRAVKKKWVTFVDDKEKEWPIQCE